MASTISTVLLTSAGLPFIYWLWTRVAAWFTMRKAGCSSPIKYRHFEPFYGMDLLMKRMKSMKEGNMTALDDKLFAEYGKTLHTISLGSNHWMTMDPLVIQAVASTHADKFGSAPALREPCGPFLGDGVFTTDGHAWQRSRDLLQPLFTQAQVSQLSSLNSHFERFLKLIPRDNSTIDIQPLAQNLFLDNSMEFIFGKSAGFLSPSEKTVEAEKFADAFDEGLRGAKKNYMTAKFSWLIGPDKDWLVKCAEVHATLDGYIKEEVELQQKSKSGGQSSFDTDPKSPATDKYILLKELVKKYPNDTKFIRNELIHIFFAARGLVGNVSSSMLFLMARRPEKWVKLREEVTAIPADQVLTIEYLKSLKYVQAVIEETLRLIHPVDKQLRTCLSPCILPHGGGKTGKGPILLQPGDEIELVYGSMHKDKDLWGEDAAEFNPERMLERSASWQYIPFSGGKRICPAQQNAYAEMAFFLVRMAQTFNTIENRDDCLEYVEEYVMIKSSRNGVKIAFT